MPSGIHFNGTYKRGVILPQLSHDKSRCNREKPNPTTRKNIPRNYFEWRFVAWQSWQNGPVFLGVIHFNENADMRFDIIKACFENYGLNRSDSARDSRLLCVNRALKGKENFKFSQQGMINGNLQRTLAYKWRHAVSVRVFHACIAVLCFASIHGLEMEHKQLV